MSEHITDAELAGYLLWYCGGRACAIVYARATGQPAVADILIARLEVAYHMAGKIDS